MKQQPKELNQKIDRLGSRASDFMRELIKPSIVSLFQARGILVRVVTREVEANNPTLGLALQIDSLVVSDDSCILIGVRSNLSIDDVNEHLEQMGKFKPLVPVYADKKVYGAVAGMVIAENVAKYAYRKGFFVIAQKGDSAVILNDHKFQPTAW